MLFLCIYDVNAQSAEGRYSSRMTQDGFIFFANPQRLKELNNIKRFEYDMTMLTWTDSITVNFTFESTSMVMPHDLRIKYDGGVVKCDAYSSLFTDIKKDYYEIRITSRYSTSDIERILKSEKSPCFCFSQGDMEESAAYNPGAWKKDRKKLNDIFNLYLYSK